MKKAFPYLIIALVCITAFSQVAFLKETLKYDILDGYLPGHYFLSECLRNNIFPLWNPYQQLGYPIYADMLNTNYVVDMFIGRMFPYTNVTFHLLFIIYIILASVGAYKLSKYSGVSDRVSLMAGIAYGLSGFITGNAQHIQFIIGAAWLPFAILFFIRSGREIRLKNTLLFVVFTWLLITGGYPSFAIMLAFGLFPLFVIYIAGFIRQKEKRKAIYFTIHCLVALILLTALCSGALLSIRQAAPFVERYNQLTYEYAVTNPFTPESLLSTLAPLVTASHPVLFGTDISMNNHYFGVILLILLIYSLTVKINKTGWLILFFALFMLFFSFGEHAFIHRIFFEYVPLFNKFRHPSSFRFITILLLLLFTGIQVTRHDPAGKEYFRLFRNVYLVCFAVVTGICVFAAAMILVKLSGPAYFKPEWQSFINDFGIYGPLFLQTAVFLLIQAVFVYFIIFRKKISWFYPLLLILLITEGIAFTRLNMRYTVTSEFKPLEIRAFLRNSPSGFPLPDDLVIVRHTEESASCVPLIHNTNTYAKTVSPYYMYPFVLDGFRQLEQDSLLFNKVINNHLLYSENPSPSDTFICEQFSPVHMTFTAKSENPVSAVLLQNNFPGWSVTIDQNKVAHRTVYKSLIGFDLPAGTHDVVFKFNNRLYIILTLGSFSLFIILLMLIELSDIRKSARSRYAAVVKLTLTGLSVALVFVPVKAFNRTQSENEIKIRDYLQSAITDSSFIVLNTESEKPFSNLMRDEKVLYGRFRFVSDLKLLWNQLDTVKDERLIYIWSNVNEPPEMQHLMQMNFPKIVRVDSGKRYRIVEFSRDSASTGDHVPYYRNNYEKAAELFTDEGVRYDSTVAFSGRYSEKLSGKREFSSTFRKILEQKPDKGISIFACAKFKQSGDHSFHLVISVNRGKKTIYYQAADLKEFKENDGWNTGFTAIRLLKSSVRKGDEIVVYVWNSGKNEAVYLDDFIVKVE